MNLSNENKNCNNPDANAVIAISGPRGFLGSTLLRTEIAGYSGIALTADIRDASAVLTEIKECKPQWIIHTAAKTSIAECESNPDNARAVNAEGTKNIADAARAVGARLIYISTVSVFSGHEGNYKEDATPEPIGNVYNITKHDGELTVLAYEKGMVLRINLIGIHPDGSRGKNFLEWIVDSAHANKDIALFNDQFINPLSNWTVAALIKIIIEKDVQEKILHIGSSDILSKAVIGKLVLMRFPDYSGTVTEKSIDSIADGIPRPKQMWLNCDRAVQLLGSIPTIAQELDTIFQRPPFNNE